MKDRITLKRSKQQDIISSNQRDFKKNYTKYLEMKNGIAEIKTWMYGLNTSLDSAEQTISVRKTKYGEITQTITEEQGDKILKEVECMGDEIKVSNG